MACQTLNDMVKGIKHVLFLVLLGSASSPVDLIEAVQVIRTCSLNMNIVDFSPIFDDHPSCNNSNSVNCLLNEPISAMHNYNCTTRTQQ